MGKERDSTGVGKWCEKDTVKSEEWRVQDAQSIKNDRKLKAGGDQTTRYRVEILENWKPCEVKEERRETVALLTQTGVIREELCEPLAVLFAVAAVAAVAERRHADFRGSQVVWGHHRTCGGEIHRYSMIFYVLNCCKSHLRLVRRCWLIFYNSSADRSSGCKSQT